MRQSRAVLAGWTKRLDHGRVASLWYADGSIRIEHTCKVVGNTHLITAPALHLDAGHQVVQHDPLTISPSILCADCGLHGFIVDGEWRS